MDTPSVMAISVLWLSRALSRDEARAYVDALD